MRKIRAAVTSIGLVLLAGLAFFLLGTKIARGDTKPFRLLELNELSINYRNYSVLNPEARNLLLYPEFPHEGIDVLMNLDLAKFGYIDASIEAITTAAQYRGIGLQMRVGVRIFDWAQFGLWHHSQHLIDRASENMPRFPAEDAIELRLIIFRSPEPRRALL